MSNIFTRRKPMATKLENFSVTLFDGILIMTGSFCLTILLTVGLLNVHELLNFTDDLPSDVILGARG